MPREKRGVIALLQNLRDFSLACADSFHIIGVFCPRIVTSRGGLIKEIQYGGSWIAYNAKIQIGKH